MPIADYEVYFCTRRASFPFRAIQLQVFIFQWVADGTTEVNLAMTGPVERKPHTRMEILYGQWLAGAGPL
jgi:hypothetical protein